MANYGKTPLKIEGLRNDNGQPFCTFLGQDTLTILEIYLKYRRNLLRHDIEPDEYVILRESRPVDLTHPVDPAYVDVSSP